MQQYSAMDELVSPASLCSVASLPSFFSAADQHSDVLEFVSCGVPEQWLMGNDELLDRPAMHDGAEWVSGGSHGNRHAAAAGLSARRRGRKPGPHSGGPTMSHVEAERQRRDKLNRRFCDLRAVVPTVSRMDKASLLADAAAYIAELRDRVEHLEAEAKQHAAAAATTTAAAHSFGAAVEEKLEVRMVGRDAAVLRLTTAARHVHAPARLMGALRALDLRVQHACVSRVGGGAAGATTVQDAVVDVPTALQDEGCLRAALLHVLHQDDTA